MRYLVITSILLLCWQPRVFSQSCLPEGITFTTQSQIDSFPILYPNCTEIEGEVKISGSSIKNLVPLSSVQSIDNNLIIRLNDSLLSLTGLENLASVNGEFLIEHNHWLQNLDGLIGLQSIGNHFRIETCHGLINLNGIEELDTIWGKVGLYKNNNLQTLHGLDSVNYIGGDIWIIKNNALSSCSVTSLCEYLSMPNGSVNIYDNAEGCNSPIEVSDSCGITLPCLPYGNYYFFNQSEIDIFQTNFPACVNLRGNVLISGNDITGLNGLTQVNSISGNLEIKENISLASLTGLDDIDSIGGELIILHNDNLDNMIGLDGLTFVGGYFLISHNENVHDLSGLSNLKNIGGHLDIRGNHELTTIDDLINLESIGGHLSLVFNKSLSNLQGLINLKMISGILMVWNNDELVNLNGLDSINHTTIGDLIIFGNVQLSQCAIESICNYLINPNGNVLLGDNLTGCNSQAEVEEACTVGIPEQRSATQLSTHPNPFTTTTTIEYELTEPSCVQLTIYNAIGEVVYKTEDQVMPQGSHTVTWSPGHLPKGMYYAILRSEDGVVVVKIVKQ
ncbi:MAG: T9SS type A sorting domain-containing protein [Bacteroidales bacterium]|nr:T9SS type A sorting domain-containing protein [Bacteroidales bacterium]